MGKLNYKDKRNRAFLFQHETKRFVLKNIIVNTNLIKSVRWKASTELTKMLKMSSSVYYVNRCILTGRRKRINKLYSFSRIMFLRLVRFGYLNGLKKASW